MTYQCLLYDVQDQIATLTLNRPERLNALSDTLREELFDAVRKSASDPNVGVLVITGAGRGFCSGGDVKSMSERDQSGQKPSPSDRFAPMRDRIARLRAALEADELASADAAAPNAATVARTLSLVALALAAAAAAIPPANPAGWICKRIGGSGGTHIVAAAQAVASPRHYYQRLMPGDPASVLADAPPGSIQIAGISRQWTVGSGPRPFRYGGAAGPARLASPLEAQMRAAVEAVCTALGLAGLVSFDFLLAGGAAHHEHLDLQEAGEHFACGGHDRPQPRRLAPEHRAQSHEAKRLFMRAQPEKHLHPLRVQCPATR